MAKRPMPPALKAYWANKRAAEQRSARKSTSVAKTNKSPSRARRAASAIRQRIRAKELAVGAATGAVATYSPAVAGEFGPGLTMVAAGVASNNETLQTMGAVSAGAAAARALGGAAGYVAPAGNGSGLI